MIYIQYPIDSSGKNPAYDGQQHPIKPINLRETVIGGMTFYILDYQDLYLGRSMTTLLIRINNNFYKVPLTDYDQLFDYIRRNERYLTQADVRDLPPTIGITQTLDFNNHVLGLKRDVPILDFNLYAPVYGRDTYGFYGFSYVTQAAYSDVQTYHFEQAVHEARIDRGVRAGAKMDVPNGVFEVQFRRGDRGVVYGVTSDGKLVHYPVLMIPGLHRYHVSYAHTDKARYDASIATTLDVCDVPCSEYRDIHNIREAFVDSYNGALEQRFKAPNKNFQPTFGSGYGHK